MAGKFMEAVMTISMGQSVEKRRFVEDLALRLAKGVEVGESTLVYDQGFRIRVTG